VVLPAWHPRSTEGTCEIYSYVIDHPDGLLVIDTGPRSGHPLIEEMYAPRVVSIIDALHHAGFDERTVMAVVNTHLHFDHCGQNDAFDQSPVWVTAAELEASLTEFYTVPEWAAIDIDRRRLSVDGEAIVDGVRLLHTPGHTPGHQSVAVSTANGLELVAGQACYSCAEYRTVTPAESDMHDPSWYQAGVDSLTRLRSLDAQRAHFSHDATTYRPD
jgi:N-acyl homoserine lactone hydrolase